MTHLQGKTAIVTGASRGIGAAAARELAAQGANVVLAARTTDQIGAVAAEISANGGQATAQATDVSDYASVAAMIDCAVQTYGRLDILVQNAGVIDPIGHLADADPTAWAQAAQINYTGVFFGLRAALPVMQGQGDGTIINISSGAAHSPLSSHEN